MGEAVRRVAVSFILIVMAASLPACGNTESPAAGEQPTPTVNTPRPAESSSPGDSGIPWGQSFATPVGELRIDEPRRVEVSDEAVGAGEGKSVVSVAVRYVNTTNQPVNILTDVSIKMEVLGVRLGGVADPNTACEIPLGDVPPGQSRYWEACSSVSRQWKVITITWEAGDRSGKAQVNVP